MSLPVLVVEDHSINQEVAILQLKVLGIESVVVDNGADAVAAVKDRQFALILMDVMIPIIDGCEASRQIRQYEQSCGQRTPIIAVSAWGGSEHRAQCAEAGMDDYLDKPYDRSALEALLKRWLPPAN